MPADPWTVVLDPSAILPERAELDLNSGAILIDQAGIDWGQAAINQYLANLRIGAIPVDATMPNRQITIPLLIGGDDDPAGFDAAVELLQQKVALIQRESGCLLRQRGGGAPRYADLTAASLTKLDAFGDTGSVEPNVSLVFEALPDFYGDEITLDSQACTGTALGPLKASGSAAVIAGDHPGRVRVQVTDTSGSHHHGLLWGFRARHYDAAATAKLAYEAEALTPLDAAAVATLSGASGTLTNNVITHPGLPGGSWCPVVYTQLAGGGNLTHQGSYRVRARVQSPSAIPQLRLVWAGADIAHPEENDPVRLPGGGAFYLVDLGDIRLDAPPVGSWQWEGVIQAMADNTGDVLSIDAIYLQPLDESAGVLSAIQPDSPFGIELAGSPGTFADAAGVGTRTWAIEPTNSSSNGSAADVTHYLKATNFDFDLPPTADISGIVAKVTRAAAGHVEDNAIRIVKGGTILTTANYANADTPWPGSPVDPTYGSPTDLWNTTWTAADINSSGFGLAISAEFITAGLAQVWSIEITVYYTLSGSFTTIEDAVIYQNRTVELRTEGMFRENSSGSVYGPIAQVIGDLPRIPPSGAESRQVELFLRVTRGDLDLEPDAGLDGLTATVLYRPSYIFPA